VSLSVCTWSVPTVVGGVGKHFASFVPSMASKHYIGLLAIDQLTPCSVR